MNGRVNFKTYLGELRERVKEVVEFLGWRGGGHAHIDFDCLENGDAMIRIDSHDDNITLETMEAIREEFPEADEVRFWNIDEEEDIDPYVSIHVKDIL